MVAGLLFCSIIAIAGYFLVRDYLEDTSFTEMAKTTILILSNVYGTLVLVIMLSYGLAFLPFSVWKRSNNSQLVFENLMSAERVSQENSDAHIEFTKEVKTCRNFVRKYSQDSNERYMDILKLEIPSEDLDGQAILNSDLFHFKLKDD